MLVLLLLSSHMGSAAVWQPDSVAYHTGGKYYLIYQRDSIGAWQLRELLTPSEYFRTFTERSNVSRFYQLSKPPEDTPKRAKPRLGIKAHGYLNFNINNTIIEDDNPLLPVALRKLNHIELKPEMNIHLRGTYGDRLQLDMTYDTSSAMMNRRSRVKLKYEGEQFDFIQRLEAGNVRMDSHNPLIDTGQDLFGIRGDFLYGPLSLQIVASRQYSEERKIVVQGGRQMRQEEYRGSGYDFAQHFFLSEFFAEQYSTALKDIPMVRSDVYVERIEVWVTVPRQIEAMPNMEPIVAYKGASVANTPPSSTMLQGRGIEIASAQKLPTSAYTLHPTLGYLSLNAPLGEGQILAVAYTYRYQGKRYEVGDIVGGSGTRRVALLSDRDKSPQSDLWRLMMKNAYSVRGARRDISCDALRVALVYKDYQSGVERPIVDRGGEAGRTWLDLFGWDRTDSFGKVGEPDGLFDLVEGVTFQRATGTLFLPFREPFVEVPSGDYPSYESLYSKSKREAEEERANDVFRIKVEFTGATTQVVQLGHSVIEPGSVRVEAGGRRLTEGIDYRIDYTSGTLSLTTSSNERIEVTIQERERVRRKEKSLLGAELTWSPVAGLNMGGTLISYWEDSRRQRIRWGEETVKNKMCGLHANYSIESRKASSWFSDWSGISLREPMRLSAQVSYAQILSDYNMPKGSGEGIILDDFEQGNRYIELTMPQIWQLGSIAKPQLRAMMSWFAIDPTLVREGALHQPTHLSRDKEQRLHPLVREIRQDEFFPKRDATPLMTQNIPMLNISFYPEERGPYNPESVSIPSDMWGSMSFSLPVTDLESERYSYVDVWMLDPFTLDSHAPEGMMYLDLGHFADRVFPDEGIYYEGSEEKQDTEWGRRARALPQMYGFDNTGRVPLELQDIGLDGLSSTEERENPKYLSFANTPDPARDDYRFYLGEEWDIVGESIIGRYKFINGLEGNSLPRVIQGVQSARTFLPDTEDLNRDMVEEREERYFRYRLPLTRANLSSSLVVGERRLSSRERWVKLRIPLGEPSEAIGSAVSLQDVHALRLSLTGFAKEAQLRIAQFRLVSTTWSEYQSSIEDGDKRSAHLSVSRLSLEEDGDKHPIPYLSPPQVEREQVATEWAVRAEDEQAVAMEIDYLEPGQPIALYKEMSLDLRHYERMELWSHLESLAGIASGELELFVRIGQDFTHNFYEYRLPLTPSLQRDYSTLPKEEARREIWRDDNRVSLALAHLPQLKQERDRVGAESSKPYVLPYRERYEASIAVQGFPSLGEVSSVLIGVRNRSIHALSAEVWLNELTVHGSRAMGGKAAQGTLQASMGELARLYVDGQYRTAGLGSITSDARQAMLEDNRYISLRTELQLGMLLPKGWGVRAPLRYMFDKRRSTPYYDPYESDILANGVGGTLDRRQSIELSELRVLPQGKKSKPWSIQNLLLRYKLETQEGFSPDIINQNRRRAESELSYNYDTAPQSFIRFNSLWNRLYRYQQYFSHDKQLSTLQSRWDWVRGLQIRQSYEGLTLSIQSTTQALVREPFEEQHRQTHTAKFAWMTEEILRDIIALGETQTYRGQLELSYRLPAFEHEKLKPLQGNATWRSNYQWQRGAYSTDRRLGNRAENSSFLDLLLYYEPLSIHFRRTSGTSLPGLLSEAGRAFGWAFFDKRMAPSLPFMLALDHPLTTFRKAQEYHWITREGGSTQALTTFWRNDLDLALTLKPLKGLEILINYQNTTQSHTSITPYETSLPIIQRGSLRYTTISRVSKSTTPEDFIKESTLLSLSKDGLPSLLSALPNWQVTYELSHLSEWLTKHFSSIRLSHAYRSYLEVPTYYREPSGVDLQSIVVSDNLSPLFGIELRNTEGISLEERYNKRSTRTLLTSSQRVLSQTDNELFSRLGYRVTFSPLFQSQIPLFRASKQSLLLQLHHTYTHTLVSQLSEQGHTTTHLQGTKGHTLQVSAEYGLSRAISVRAFFERQQRKPLVSNYTYPYRRTTYGVLIRLQLQP